MEKCAAVYQPIVSVIHILSHLLQGILALSCHC
jgi:hypothetical protein